MLVVIYIKYLQESNQYSINQWFYEVSNYHIRWKIKALVTALIC